MRRGADPPRKGWLPIDDRWKFHDITHRDHVSCSPRSPAKLAEVVGLQRLPDGARAADIACGKGQLTTRIAERHAAHAVGADPSPSCVRDPRARASGRTLRGSVAFLLGDGARHAVEPASLDLAACVGATWVFGGHAGRLAALAAMLRRGGLVLVGERCWRAGLMRDLCPCHAGDVAAGPPLGLTPLHALASGEDGWDRHQGLQWQAAERHAGEHPDDPDVPERLRRVRRSRDAHLGGGGLSSAGRSIRSCGRRTDRGWPPR